MAPATAIIMGPVMLIALQPDMGSVVTYFAFFIVLFREGMSLYVFISAVLAVVLFLLTLIFGNVPVALGIIAVSFIILMVFSGFPTGLKAMAVMAVTGGISFLLGTLSL